MKQEPSLTKPTWWLLYAIGLLMLGLLALIAALVDEGTGRTILEVAVVDVCECRVPTRHSLAERRAG